MSGYGLDEGRCRSCGKKLFWGRTPEGKAIPLDAVAPVYEIDEMSGRVVVERTHTAFVSHFATCPNASTHSRKGKGQQR